MKDGKKLAAIVLAAGSGKRMGSNTPKQFLEINGKPLLYFCLKVFQDSFIDEIIIVARPSDRDYIKKDIVENFSFGKVTRIVDGGKERFHSVAAGLEAIDDCDYVFIHDGARPFVNENILEDAFETVTRTGSAITAVPSKDTVKIIGADGSVVETPDRNTLFNMQTPQTFEFELIRDCYRKLINSEKEISEKNISVTDDAMVMELFSNKKVYVSKGDYKNIKVTTPEDLIIASAYLQNEL